MKKAHIGKGPNGPVRFSLSEKPGLRRYIGFLCQRNIRAKY